MRLRRSVVGLTLARTGDDFRLLLAYRMIALLGAPCVAAVGYVLAGSLHPFGRWSPALGGLLFAALLVGEVLANRGEYRLTVDAIAFSGARPWSVYSEVDSSKSFGVKRFGKASRSFEVIAAALPRWRVAGITLAC